MKNTAPIEPQPNDADDAGLLQRHITRVGLVVSANLAQLIVNRRQG
jgi:hypothetical protein